ncbi:hypothetical protein OZ411_24900 [Bradyrhizobium sp. Arg237L]|nr:hypothetical protein [Bradyrhizobium sp. Arg237L]MDI4236054.1 hypothetical protein [Bradyrhizobium sp. Arg237L]
MSIDTTRSTLQDAGERNVAVTTVAVSRRNPDDRIAPRNHDTHG